jgi:hypothetical protein
MPKQKSDSDKSALIARGRLKDARKWFAHRGWEVLPQGIRGQLILRWVADHAWLAYPADPKGAVRRHCGPLAPSLKEEELDELITATVDSNKRWSHDQSATVLEISMGDSRALNLRFLGCDDDPTFERRLKEKRAKKAASARARRAARRTGDGRGRPGLTSEEKQARKAAKGIVSRELWLAANSKSRTEPWKTLNMSKSKYYRLGLQDPAVRQVWSENASPDKLRKTGKATQFNADLSHAKTVPPTGSGSGTGAPEAPPPPHRPIIVRLDDVPDGLILDQDGNEFKPPPPHQRRPPPRDWMDAAMEGMNRGRA